MKVLSIRNRQRICRVDLVLFKRIIRVVLHDILGCTDYELGLYIVGAEEMAVMNETFLQHAGSTDVITFDYNDSSSATLHGEVFICMDDALEQAKQFKTSWQSELTRYAVHSLLHLLGYDDLQPEKRRVMKREENRLLKQVAKQFNLSKLQRAQSK
ncbi:MAG: rRNA maturation RNase YbeY [Verrucomicrobia bacterium]|nr:rRNA maturation RNase YbeY [Verrucomicrobiota bacterium]